MMTVADKGGLSLADVSNKQKYLNFGNNFFKSSGPITMRESTALIYSPKLMAG